jgi:regulator of protease activity HflC (stomatin/prohibitin superfamily)
VGESQRGVLYVDSKAVAWLAPGRHDVWSRDRQVTMTTLAIDADVQAIESLAEVDALAPEHEATTLVVPQDHLAVVARDGRPVRAVAPGRYLLWQGRREVTATLYPTDGLRVEVPRNQWGLLGEPLVRQVVVRPFERAVLYVDGRRVEVLEAGAHAFNAVGRQIAVHAVDMRERETQIQGQELMTADKVTLRVNLIVTWRVTDALASVESQTNLDGAIYSEAQMSARRYIAGLSVDELLEGRREASDRMLERLAERAARWGVEVTQIDLKDVILPGEMKTLLNRVIEAEKKAAANVIMRREETAATRSQANTAKMLEANPTLMRLKELEAVREIAAEVGSVQIVAGTDGLLERFRLS